MVVTREMMIQKLSAKTGYNLKDIRKLLYALDEVTLECLGEVTDDEDVVIQFLTGLKLGCSVVPEWERINPRTRETMVCKPTCKPNAKFSVTFKQTIQEQYEK